MSQIDKDNIVYTIYNELIKTRHGVKSKPKRENKMNELQNIEFSYSSIIKKFTVRTKGIELKGAGIIKHHSEKDTGLYSVYSLTRKAFEKISSQYEMSIY